MITTQRVQSKIDQNGRVVNRIVDVPLAAKTRVSQQPFGPDYRRGLCLPCGHPQQLNAPHGWTCQRCDPVSVSVSA